MSDINDKKSNIPLEDDLLLGVAGGLGAGNGCDVREGQFPKLGKCLADSRTLSGMVFSQVCPYCTISTSLPEGANLVVAHMLECTRYGYVKRLKE